MRNGLTKSILTTVTAYFLLQVAIFLAFAYAYGLYPRFGASFFALAIGFHALLLGTLLSFQKDFYIEATGEVLTRINRANLITLFRVSTLPTLLVLVIAAKSHPIRTPLLFLVLLVFLSDFFDGYVSRKYGQVTRVGRMLDSASDYCLLIVLAVVFFYFAIIPSWFFGLVVGRLFLQAALMGILILVKGRVDPQTTWMGKVAVATIMVLYAAELLRMAIGLERTAMTAAFEIAAGIIVSASVVDKILYFIRELAKAKAEAAKKLSPVKAEGQ